MPTVPIHILCPQYHALVRGHYACDAGGRALLGPGGEYLLDHARCRHNGGRCPQTLCVLHRYNRRGPGSWFPEKIVPAPAAGPAQADGPEPSSRRSRSARPAAPPNPTPGDLDLLA